ncbi:uncharacterized protein BO96DRAFT_430047 [Aspergillus niger CBS 101883]|uniref:Uncharacterized protein n=2 Tax=Aspergillus niger TaxID=5061 RepID=A2R7Y0_ASPNC|nr:uncharacterized protein BO96DRAFT_430047 [Aspergillus niger CBS 101883]XP_059606548.1 hypothetical protein An16g05140 [Aspergillus niger]PYH61454.1 hypothetical protein BO96DRAFT_430047 [Aspergillus niger CBS 101883]CAK97368.1 hypothetical protein An16g05140 [Aspergillus niger]
MEKATAQGGGNQRKRDGAQNSKGLTEEEEEEGDRKGRWRRGGSGGGEEEAAPEEEKMKLQIGNEVRVFVVAGREVKAVPSCFLALPKLGRLAHASSRSVGNLNATSEVLAAVQHSRQLQGSDTRGEEEIMGTGTGQQATMELTAGRYNAGKLPADQNHRKFGIIANPSPIASPCAVKTSIGAETVSPLSTSWLISVAQRPPLQRKYSDRQSTSLPQTNQDSQYQKQTGLFKEVATEKQNIYPLYT